MFQAGNALGLYLKRTPSDLSLSDRPSKRSRDEEYRVHLGDSQFPKWKECDTLLRDREDPLFALDHPSSWAETGGPRVTSALEGERWHPRDENGGFDAGWRRPMEFEGPLVGARDENLEGPSDGREGDEEGDDGGESLGEASGPPGEDDRSTGEAEDGADSRDGETGGDEEDGGDSGPESQAASAAADDAHPLPAGTIRCNWKRCAQGVNPNHWEVHMNTAHSGWNDAPFACYMTGCSLYAYQFSERGALKRHARGLHFQEPVSGRICPYCRRKFSRPDACVRHEPKCRSK